MFRGLVWSLSSVLRMARVSCLIESNKVELAQVFLS